MPKFLQGISITQILASVDIICLFLAADGITLGKVGSVSGVVFIGGLALVGVGLAAKPWYNHSTIDQVHAATESVLAGGPPVASAPDPAQAKKILPSPKVKD